MFYGTYSLPQEVHFKKLLKAPLPPTPPLSLSFSSALLAGAFMRHLSNGEEEIRAIYLPFFHVLVRNRPFSKQTREGESSLLFLSSLSLFLSLFLSQSLF